MDKLETHLTFEELADYIDGRSTAVDAARAAEHLAGGCAACQREFDWLRRTTAVMAEQWHAPPKVVRANVHRAYRYYIPASRQEENTRPQGQPVPWVHRLFKRRMRFVTAVLAVLVLLLFSGQYYQSWAQDVVQHSAALVELNGTVEVQRAGSESWEPLSNAARLAAGDKIRTGPGASAGLQFFENNITYLGPETQVEIVAFTVRRDGRERIITLKQYNGQINSSGWPPGTEITYLSIRTPLAVVAVQALGYDVLINSTGDTEISVIKGCAEIVNYDASTRTSYRQQTGSACARPAPVQNEPIAPVHEL